MQLPSRQVHLDFHTSELIPAVGELFDRRQWQKALKMGRVNSITVFAKCHHGWSYYPTKVGNVHPTLKRNLLGEQIAACHQIGVRAPIYYTVGWSAHDAESHPEWLVCQKDRTPILYNMKADAKPTDPLPPTAWKFLCPSAGYAELIFEQTREICETFDVDGLFYDICFRGPCYCDVCLAGMRAEGLDPDVDANVIQYNIRKWQKWMGACDEIIRRRWPNATIFYNGGASPREPQWHGWQTHFELEEIPTTWGGYDKFPVRSRYFAARDRPYLAMSGKFHTSWGEFGGYKHPDAMRAEAATMIAYGARCSFGDQLHPSGRMDPSTYENLGKAYKYVERIEEYGLDGVPASDLGLWLKGFTNDAQGAASMLLELHLDFRIVDADADLKSCRAIVLPGDPLDARAAEALKEYLRGGGQVLALGEALLDSAKSGFALDAGAKYIGPARYVSDYLAVGDALAEGMVRSPLYMYTSALRAETTDGESLAGIHEPYFDRTYEHYCSHLNTPPRVEPADHPAAWRKGRIVCLAHPLGRIYQEHGAHYHRQLFRNALRMVYPSPRLTVELPSAGRVTLLHQPRHSRYVAHLLYAPPLLRGRCLVIEDMPPLLKVPVTLRVPEQIRRAALAPQGRELKITADGAAVGTVVPRIAGHQALVFEY